MANTVVTQYSKVLCKFKKNVPILFFKLPFFVLTILKNYLKKIVKPNKNQFVKTWNPN